MDQQTIVAECTGCKAKFHHLSQKYRTLLCCFCGAALTVYELPQEPGTMMEAAARSIVFPPAPLRLPRWRIA